ncbi:Uma2 family endonuclease [Streptomyces sp. NBC_01142]|uniref:Uma2 family endonuclease n=1 Tax=Streptomyces sp. NBC_01142 TaxID=2975865 RepID=UPI002258247A|nr:Uma2 family endonuclease [Streptomyces sp. NBC_01142]MCX4823668.1 Uma2 family endonuclease [Streptomyces sp. NBC_01142]
MRETRTDESVPHWPVPPQDGYTVDDLLTLPDLPRHTELIDGSLVFASPQRCFHFIVIDLLVAGLRRTVPPELRVCREMTVVIDKRNGPEPDISVVRAESVTGPDTTHFLVADVVLAVEVVSPDSEARDKDTKPHKYARAGIPHFWLVDRSGEGSRPVVRVYELDAETSAYTLKGIHHDVLKMSSPFHIDIDLTEIDHL